jgi:hypothetical protein
MKAGHNRRRVIEVMLLCQDEQNSQSGRPVVGLGQHADAPFQMVAHLARRSRLHCSGKQQDRRSGRSAPASGAACTGAGAGTDAGTGGDSQ